MRSLLSFSVVPRCDIFKWEKLSQSSWIVWVCYPQEISHCRVDPQAHQNQKQNRIAQYDVEEGGDINLPVTQSSVVAPFRVVCIYLLHNVQQRVEKLSNGENKADEKEDDGESKQDTFYFLFALFLCILKVEVEHEHDEETGNTEAQETEEEVECTECVFVTNSSAVYLASKLFTTWKHINM